MEPTTHLSISGENNTVQVGPRNYIFRSDIPMDVNQFSGDDDDEDEDDDDGWTEAPQGDGQPGVPQLPHADLSTPDVDISGSGHSVQTGKTCLQMSPGADPHQVSRIAATRMPNGGGSFSPKVKIRGQNHDIQVAETCIKLLSSPAVPGQMQSPLSQGSASVNGVITPPTTEGVEEEGDEADYDQSQYVRHNIHIRPLPALSSLEVDDGDQTDLKRASTPQLPFPHQESANGMQAQGDNPAKWQLLSPEERRAGETDPQIPANIMEGLQREVDLNGDVTGLTARVHAFEDDEISNVSSLDVDTSVSSRQSTPTIVFNKTSKSSFKNTPSRPDLSVEDDDEICNDMYPGDSLDTTLKAATVQSVELSASLSQSRWNDRSTGSLSTRTLTSSVQSQHSYGSRLFDPQSSREHEISNGAFHDADAGGSVQKADVLTDAVAKKASTSLEKSRQDWRIEEKSDVRASGKGQETPSSIPVASTFTKKSTYSRSHSLDMQPRESVGFAERRLASFYSSQTAAVAAELRSGFTDNEISNDAIYEIETDSVPEEKHTPLPEREHEMKNRKPAGVTAMNVSPLSSDSQHVEIRQQSLENLAGYQDWGHQLSDDEDAMADEDYDIQNPGISNALSHDSSPSMLGIDFDFRSRDNFRSRDDFRSKDVLSSLSARASLQSSLAERVNRMEQVLGDVRQVTSERQRVLQSRLDRLEGLMEKVLQIMTAQNDDTPTSPSGSAPASLQGDVHYRALGDEGRSQKELASGRVEGFQNRKTAGTDFYEQKRGYPVEAFKEEQPSYEQHGKAGKNREMNFKVQSFKGDASVRPKQRPFTGRHQEDVDTRRRGSKGVHTETTKGKKGVLAATRDTYGDTRDTRRHEAGTAGQDGGIRVYAGELRQDSGGRGGTETDEAEVEDEHLEVRTRPRKPARKEFPRSLPPQPSALDQEDLEEDSVVAPRKMLEAFSIETLDILEEFFVVANRSEVMVDPEAFRLATAVERALEPAVNPKPGMPPMPPRAIGMCTMLVLDNSESMEGKPLQQALKFANDFLDGVEDEAEQHSNEENVAIVTIGGGVNVIHHLTNDYNSLRSALEGIRAKGRSPFFEAIVVCIAILHTQITMMTIGKRQSFAPRVIFVTDGKITDESRPRGPDTPATDPKAKTELVQLLQTLHKVATYPRPVVWVPVEGADKTFMDLMGKVPGNKVVPLKEVNYLSSNFFIQRVAGSVLACIVDMPEAPVHLGECIRSHIEVLHPTLSKELKDMIFCTVVRSFSQQQLSILALKRRTEGRKTGETRGHPDCPACQTAKHGHPLSPASEGHSKDDH